MPQTEGKIETSGGAYRGLPNFAYKQNAFRGNDKAAVHTVDTKTLFQSYSKSVCDV